MRLWNGGEYSSVSANVKNGLIHLLEACIGQYAGAIKLSQAELAKYEYVNPHIHRLAAQRDLA
jgi:hypothetical protein